MAGCWMATKEAQLLRHRPAAPAHFLSESGNPVAAYSPPPAFLRVHAYIRLSGQNLSFVGINYPLTQPMNKVNQLGVIVLTRRYSRSPPPGKTLIAYLQ